MKMKELIGTNKNALILAVPTLAILAILYEILSFNYCSNGKC